jgi:hypothetical protein
MANPRTPNFEGLDQFTTKPTLVDPLTSPEHKIETSHIEQEINKQPSKTPAVKKPKKDKVKKEKVLRRNEVVRESHLSTMISLDTYEKLEELQYKMRRKTKKKIHLNYLIEEGVELLYAKHIKDLK